MDIRVYIADYKEDWDHFVRESKNGTFLFCRDFMEYHSHRFSDHSLMFYSRNKLVALMPGHIKDGVYYSHQGLTYGGLVMSAELSMSVVLDIFENLITAFRLQGIQKIIYKAIPHIYHKLPSEEDLYALFLHNAVLVERSISSTILLDNQIGYAKLRKRGIKKAEENGLEVEKSSQLEAFWVVLSSNLEAKYGAKPTHSLSEISHLSEQFPEELHLFNVVDTHRYVLAGVIVFETETTVHIQYVAATAEGKSKGAIDILIDYLIKRYSDKRYFDYGISTENKGLDLNKNLISQKEGFGCRGVVYDVYEINL